MQTRFRSLASFGYALAAAIPMTAALPAAAQAPVYTAELAISPTMYDFEGTRKFSRMYFPSVVGLSTQKPESVTAEPDYAGQPMYATITLGNDASAQRVIVVDGGDTSDARFYADLNGNGDLTDDGDGSWDNTSKSDAGLQYQTTAVFQVGYADSDKTTPYGVNFYFREGGDGINYYRAAARTGSINIDGTDYAIVLTDEDANAVFSEAFPEDGSWPEGGLGKPNFLVLGGSMADARGTFQLKGMNWKATISDDGSKISLSPTFKVIEAPQPPNNPAAQGLLPAGSDAPDFTAKTPGGDILQLSDYEGKVVLIDFWATWCGPCIKAMPHVQEVYDAYHEKGVEFVSLCVFDNERAFDNWMKANGDKYKFDFAYDTAGRGEASIARKMYGIRAIPTMFVIDKNGKVAGSVVGFNPEDTKLTDLLDAALADEAPKEPTKMVPMMRMGG